MIGGEWKRARGDRQSPLLVRFRAVSRDRKDVLRLAQAGYIDCGVLKARYLEEVRPYLLNKHEWHDQTLELWIEMIAAPSSNKPKAST